MNTSTLGLAAGYRGGRVDEIITCELRPDLVREARLLFGLIHIGF